MGKKKNNKKFKGEGKFSKLSSLFTLPEETKKWIWGIVIFILALIVALSFFDLAGIAGTAVMASLTFLIGKAVFIVPLILILGGLVFFNTKYDKFLGPAILAMLVLLQKNEMNYLGKVN